MLGMRLFITSAPDDLEPHRGTAETLARELGFRVLARQPTNVVGNVERSELPVPARVRHVATADAVLALVGHRRGEAPPPEFGGDSFHPWAWWEVRAAFDRGLPVTVLMAADESAAERVEADPLADSVIRDFRAELTRLAALFEADDLEGFRFQAREALAAIRSRGNPGGERPAAAQPAGRVSTVRETGPRRWPPPSLPASPYPVLLPYTHPDLLAGRDRELREIVRLLERPLPILGLHAASGTGKSSFLGGGLVPGLRAEGRPVAFERRALEPGLVRRLLGDLVIESAPIDDRDCHGFVDRMRELRDRTGAPPILILDQLECLFGAGDDADQGARQARGVVASLLAASVQRLSGLGEPPCRWLLAYRREFHGRVYEWLRDLSKDLLSRGPVGVSLPRDLGAADRFQSWSLPALGTPPPKVEGRAEAAAQIFREVIEKPLTLTGDDGTPIYPYRFAAGHAERLACLFGEARIARRNAPLAPELQVVLAHLLQQAGPGAEGTVVEVRVPENAAALLDHALEEHLRRSLDFAFPSRYSATKGSESRLSRTRALLALRELADLDGRLSAGQTSGVLARAIGDDGRDVLERLATAQTRIVLLQSTAEAGAEAEEPVYRLSHDRMAEVIVRQVDDEGTYAGLGIDADLLALRRFVALKCRLFSAGEQEQATAISKSRLREIERFADCLLFDEPGRRWWRACLERRNREQRRAAKVFTVAAGVVASLILVVALWTGRILEIREQLDTVERGDPEASFAALASLSTELGVDADRIFQRLARRRAPFDILERGLGGIDGEARGAAVLRATEWLLPLQRETAPMDPQWIASIAWALDFFAWPEAALRSRAEALRAELLRPLREARPPPPPPVPDDSGWVVIPAGTFRMGLDPGEEPDGDPFEETPAHRVTISAFRLQAREVTVGEIRRLMPDYSFPGAAELPAGYIDWYEAYTYAAWLGGRLPSEAEWEYAARGDCPHPFCKGDGSQAEVDEVAWWTRNSVDAKSGEPGRKPVGQLEPNPWGLFDIHGNVHEWTADWTGPYSEEPATDPPGPAGSPGRLRSFRGSSAVYTRFLIGPSRRGAHAPHSRIPQIGLRVAVPLERPLP